jgi:hypothetical protein
MFRCLIRTWTSHHGMTRVVELFATNEDRSQTSPQQGPSGRVFRMLLFTVHSGPKFPSRITRMPELDACRSRKMLYFSFEGFLLDIPRTSLFRNVRVDVKCRICNIKALPSFGEYLEFYCSRFAALVWHLGRSSDQHPAPPKCPSRYWRRTINYLKSQCYVSTSLEWA